MVYHLDKRGVFWMVCVGGKTMKKVSVSNYNLVYISGDKEEPLLEHFDSILMPALRSGIVNGSGDTT